MNEVKDYIRIKKKKKAKKKLLMIGAIIVILLIIVFIKAPIFNLQNIEIIGTSKISMDSVLSKIDNRIGENIFLINKNKLKDEILQEPYFKSVKIKVKNVNTLEIIVTEESPAYYVIINDQYYVLNNNGVIIEIVDTIENRNLVEIIGVQAKNSSLGADIIDNSTIEEILEKIYPYIKENTDPLKIDEIDLSKTYNLKAKIGDIEIIFGDISDFHNKINKVYNIIYNESIGIKEGYIDVSNIDMPIIKKEVGQEE